MHKVNRGIKPKSLNDNATKWTRELLVQVPLNKTFTDIPSKYVNKYKQEDVKQVLTQMYEGLCCYCESPIGVQTYEQIEHLKPKSIFPRFCFEWNNLHLSCQICNISYKKANWDNDNPILDPTVDNIEDFIEIDLESGEIIPISNNERANTTIEHTGLNRVNLVKRRNSIIIIMKKLLKIAVNANEIEEFKEILETMSVDMGYKLLFSSFIKKI
ncbi:retron system putative HNH endonuclease [Clostridium estertheticum]|uniref:retron system putative HNH endonuclease n=1 Tax=Clostridium estertheticum TaxID=238834 RepID=UPI001CF1A787|nr:retron system putative HNH endonuclease [Clostridium estertheticum]MCB2354378.1 TIGR02646 family protein [Clostridium estertheticum]WAG42503.1 TIGR02646 family protein [Clostridium estertheticum]